MSKTGDTPAELREIHPGQARSSQSGQQLLSECHGENSRLKKIYQGPASTGVQVEAKHRTKQKNSIAALNPSSWNAKQKKTTHINKNV